MRKNLFWIGVLILLFLLSGGVGYSLARAESSHNGDQPQSPETVYPNMGSYFTYQGVLKENGQPVTGTRKIAFYFSRNSDCSAPFYDVSQSGIPVSNGLFSFDVPVQNYVFNGEQVLDSGQGG